MNSRNFENEDSKFGLHLFVYTIMLYFEQIMFIVTMTIWKINCNFVQ